MTLFPLNDGEDCLLLDWTGSMTLPYPIHNERAWWFKAGRWQSGVMRRETPLIRPGLLMKNPEGLEFNGHSEQEFNPRTGILYTRLHLSESVLDIESLLWGSCFIRKVTVLSAPPNTELIFTLNDRRLWKGFEEFKPSQSHRYFSGGSGIGFHYSHEPDQEFVQHGAVPSFAGTGRSIAWRDTGDSGRPLPAFSCPRFLHGTAAAIAFERVREGQSFFCAVAVLDNMSPCGEDHAGATAKLLADARALGHEKIATKVREHWTGFQNSSRIELEGNSKANYFFELSQYATKASQHPGGSIPCVAYYSILNGSAYWDHWGPAHAFNRLNHPTEGRQVGRFWASCLPEARRQAEKLGAKGARIPWTCAPQPNPGLCTRFPQVQYHNIGVAINSCWDAHVFYPDKEYLREIFPIIAESAEFLATWLLQKRDGGEVYARAVGSLDENPQPRKNDSWTIASTLRVLEIYEKAAILLKKSRIDYGDQRKTLLSLLHANYSEGALTAYPGARRQSLGAVLPFRFLPDLPGFEKSFEGYERDSREAEGLGLGPYTHARGRIFPWIQAKAAAILTPRRQPDIWRNYLAPLLDYTDCWGGLPEVWRHNREISMPWYLGAHGFYLTVLAELLADRSSDGGIDLLWGADPSWGAVTFENLRLPGALSVSGRHAYGTTRELIIHHEGHQELSQLTIRHPGPNGGRRETILEKITPGEKVALV